MHKSVLLQETLDALDLRPGEIFLDGTFGAGGHARGALSRFGDKIRVIALDQDPDAIERSKDTGIEVVKRNFRELDQVLQELGIEKVDAILFDLGFSSDQLELSGRGFSFLRDEPLDMRMSGTGPTAAEILNSWDESAIELVLQGFGEERLSRKIAREIVERREVRPFRTSFDLVEAVLAVRPKTFRDKIHPATRTFQAIRIATNGELEALETGLAKGFESLNSGGRFAVISFHSLEDRIVKNFFRDKVKETRAKAVTKKPITASEEEVMENPRSHSAKLRVIEKI